MGVSRTSSASLSFSLRTSVVREEDRRGVLAGERERLRRVRPGERERDLDRERATPCLNTIVLCNKENNIHKTL